MLLPQRRSCCNIKVNYDKRSDIDSLKKINTNMAMVYNDNNNNVDVVFDEDDDMAKAGVRLGTVLAVKIKLATRRYRRDDK